jgi:glycerol kinase
MLTTIAWQLENKPQIFALEGAIFIAGAAMQWLRDGLQVIASSDESEALAYSVQSNDGVYFVPALVGLGSPWWDSDVRGVITGITRGTGRAHFVRAALESMAYQVADVSAAMIKNGIPLSQLKIDGGATRNKFLLQFQADVLNIPIIRSGQVEATAWGAGALAGTTHGVIADLEEVTSKRSDDLLISPQSDRTAEYDGWKKALAGAFHTAGKKAPVSSELTGAR